MIAKWLMQTCTVRSDIFTAYVLINGYQHTGAYETVPRMTGGFVFWVVLLLGNLLIIGLEGLVTGIQTTRLGPDEFSLG